MLLHRISNSQRQRQRRLLRIVLVSFQHLQWLHLPKKVFVFFSHTTSNHAALISYPFLAFTFRCFPFASDPTGAKTGHTTEVKTTGRQVQYFFPMSESDVNLVSPLLPIKLAYGSIVKKDKVRETCFPLLTVTVSYVT